MNSTVDVHTHLSPKGDDALAGFARRNGFAYNLEELTRLLRENGISKALLLSPPLRTGGHLSNEDVIEMCDGSRGVLSPVLTVTPTQAGVKATVSLAKANAGKVKGLKVLLGYDRAFATDPVLYPAYDYSEETGIPVMFHTGDTADSTGSLMHAHPLTLDALANERPGLKLVACHFGNPWIEDVGELIYKHENVFADVSGLSVGESKYSAKYGEWLVRKLSEAIYFAGGAEKVLFGSDYPVTHPKNALELVARLEIDESDRERILAGNARRVFSL